MSRNLVDRKANIGQHRWYSIELTNSCYATTVLTYNFNKSCYTSAAYRSCNVGQQYKPYQLIDIVLCKEQHYLGNTLCLISEVWKTRIRNVNTNTNTNLDL